MTIDQNIMIRLRERQKKLERLEKNLSRIHDCDKCHDRTVAIGVDVLGNTYCGYCGKKVDYFSDMKHDD